MELEGTMNELRRNKGAQTGNGKKPMERIVYNVKMEWDGTRKKLGSITKKELRKSGKELTLYCL